MSLSPKALPPIPTLPSLLLLAPLFSLANAQPELSDGVRCAANRSIYPCQAYTLYRANPAGVPFSVDLPFVGELFGANRSVIARTSNLTIDESILPLRQNQLLLIPVTCGCDHNRSYAPAAYQIFSRDTFYLLSISTYGNLTAYPAIMLVNPTLNVTDLQIGTIATIPIFCQCLNNRNIGGRQVLGLVSYVLQPLDTYDSVAAAFDTDVNTLFAINGPEDGTYSVVFVPLFQIPPPLLRTSIIAEAPVPASTPSDVAWGYIDMHPNYVSVKIVLII